MPICPITDLRIPENMRLRVYRKIFRYCVQQTITRANRLIPCSARPLHPSIPRSGSLALVGYSIVFLGTFVLLQGASVGIESITNAANNQNK